jgi:hypothetical protein
MTPFSRVATANLLFVVCSAAYADPHLNLSLAGVTDDNDSHSLDADVAFAPNPFLELGAGVGSSTSPSTVGGIDGTSLRGSANLHSDRLGLRGYYRQWNSQLFDTDALGARASVTAGDFTFNAGGEARGLDVTYGSGTSDPQRSTQHFSGRGLGGGIKYSHSGWTGYADAMFFHYGSLSRYVQTYTANPVPIAGAAPVTPVNPLPPLLQTVAALPVGAAALNPILPALPQTMIAVAPILTSSVVTLDQGALDRLVTVGASRAFARVSFSLDWTNAKDKILADTTDSYRAGVGYKFTDHVSAAVAAGVTHSYVGSVKFGAANLGFSF